MKWDEETVKALKFIILKTVADQAHGETESAHHVANTKFCAGLEPTPTTSQSPI